VTHRPYPSPVRARHQLDRHVHCEDVPTFTMSPANARLFGDLMRALQPTAVQGMANMRAALAAMPSARDFSPPAPSDRGSGT
jgi:hypothetical protein